MATSILGTSSSVLGSSLVLGASGGAVVRNLSASTTLSFTQTVGLLSVRYVTGESELSFTQSIVDSVPRYLDASNTVMFSQSGHKLEVFDLSANDIVSFEGSTTSGSKARDAISEFELDQLAGAGHEKLSGTSVGGETTFAVDSSATVVRIKSTAIELDATSEVDFRYYGGFPTDVSAESTLEFVGTSDDPFIFIASNTVGFISEASVNVVRSINVTSNVTFTQAFAVEGALDTKRFNDYGSAALTKPTLTTQRYVTFSLDELSITLPRPEFGNRDRLAMMRINRESRGGDLSVFGDSHWPKTKSLTMEFINVRTSCGTYSTPQEVLDFKAATLGQEIELVDWEGNSWTGVIVNPDSEHVQNQRGMYDITIEFEGERV